MLLWMKSSHSQTTLSSQMKLKIYCQVYCTKIQRWESDHWKVWKRFYSILGLAELTHKPSFQKNSDLLMFPPTTSLTLTRTSLVMMNKNLVKPWWTNIWFLLQRKSYCLETLSSLMSPCFDLSFDRSLRFIKRSRGLSIATHQPSHWKKAPQKEV